MNRDTIIDYIENFPFLTIGNFNNEEIVGIVQKIKDGYIYIYIFNIIKDIEMRKKFLDLGNKWWWESNRIIPINIFLGNEFEIFKNCLRIYNIKNFDIIYGPAFNTIKNKKYKKINLLLTD